MPAANSLSGYAISIDVTQLTSGYQVDSVKQKDNLGECDLGRYHNGVECKRDSSALKMLAKNKIEVGRFKVQTSTTKHQFGFYFRLTSGMMQTYADGYEMTLMESLPANNPCHFIRFKMKTQTNLTWTAVPPTISPGPPVPSGSPPSPPISTPNPPVSTTNYYHHSILENSCLAHDLENLYGADLFYRPGLWLYMYRKANVAGDSHRSVVTGYLNYRMHTKITNGAAYQTPGPGDHIIYFGHQNSQNQDFDFSMRDFFIDYTTDDMMFLDQAIMLRRNRFQIFKLSNYFTGLNESSGLYVRSATHPESQFNIRTNNFVWEYDPQIPPQCEGPYEVHVNQGYEFGADYSNPAIIGRLMSFCQRRQIPRFREQYRAEADRIEISSLNIGGGASLSSTENFSITAMLRINGDPPKYDKLQNIFTVNPTTSSPIYMRGNHYYDGAWYRIQLKPNVHGVAGPMLECSEILNRWGIIGIIKSGSTYTYLCHYDSPSSRQSVTIGGFPKAWDSKVYLGHISGTLNEWMTFDGYMKDFKFYNEVISNAQIRSDFFQQRPYAPFYYPLDVPVMTSYFMMNHGQTNRQFIYTNSLAYPNTEPYENIDKCKDLWNANDIVGWNEWNHVQRFQNNYLIDNIIFPAVSPPSWTLELRFQKKTLFNEMFFQILGWIEISGRIDGGCLFQIGTTSHQSLSFLKMDEWMHIALVSGATTTELYVDGIFFETLNTVGPMITNPSMPWYSKGQDIAIKDIKIWSIAQPLSFIQQIAQKEIDGSYYSNLVYYQLFRIQYNRQNQGRVYKNQNFYDIDSTAYGAVYEPPDRKYCGEADDVFDGISCNTYRYVHLNSPSFSKLQLPIKFQSALNQWTLEFWILFKKGASIGPIVIVKCDGPIIKLEETTGSPGTVRIVICTTATICAAPQTIYTYNPSLSFKITYWKKFILTFNAGIASLQVDSSPAQSSTNTLPSLKVESLNFCDISGVQTCDFVLRHVILWSKIQAYSTTPRTPPLWKENQYIVAYWPLDEGKGEYFNDYGPSQTKYPIVSNHPSQNFRWKNIHQIQNYMDHLLICIDQALNYDEKTGRCEPVSAPSIQFTPSTSPPVLKQFNTIGSYQIDWSIDFWVKFIYTTSFIPFVILNQESTSCSDTSVKQVALRISLTNGPTAVSIKLLTDDVLDLTRAPNENLSPIIQPNTYIHLSLVNSGSLNTLTSTLNFTTSSSVSSQPAFDHLSSCDFVIGNAASSDPSTTFIIKQFKLWSAALKNDEFLQWSLTNVISQGYPNLVLYYRLDNDFFTEQISQQSSNVLDTQYIVRGENDFAIGCPIGYTYNWIQKICTHYDYVQYYSGASKYEWDFKNDIVNDLKDQDASFTLYTMSYVPYANQTFTVLKLGEFVHIRWVYTTYVVQIFLNGQIASFPIEKTSTSNVVDDWFVTFDFSVGQLNIVFNSIQIAPALLSHEMLKSWNSITFWKAVIGNSGELSEIATNGFKQIEIFRPPLKYQQIKMIENKKITSHLKGSMNLKSGVSNNVNQIFWNTPAFNNAFNIKDSSLAGSNTGTMTLHPQGNSCILGSNIVGFQCVEPSHLLIQKDTLALNLDVIKVATCMTVQAWFNFKSYMNDPLGNPTVFISIPDFLVLSYKDETLTLVITEDSLTSTITDFKSLSSASTFIDKWVNVAVTLKQYQWIVYINSQPLINIVSLNLNNYENLDIKKNFITSPNLQTIMRVKEFAFFGHTKDYQELVSDQGSFKSQIFNFNQMLAYYQIGESGQNQLTDLSNQGRVTSLTSNTGVYWEYDGRGQQFGKGNQINSDASYTSFVTKDKSLYFNNRAPGDQVQIGTLPNDLIDANFTLTLFISVDNQNTIPSGSIQNIISISSSTLQLVKLSLGNSNAQCLISSDTSPILALMSPNSLYNQKWIYIYCGNNQALKLSYNHAFNPTSMLRTGDTRYLGTALTDLDPSGFNILVYPFNGYLRELRYFSECLDPAIALKYSMQRLSTVNSIYKLKYSMPLDESFGDKYMEAVSGQMVSPGVLTSTNYPSWQKPKSELEICEGHSRYSFESDFCQYDEKFMKVRTTSGPKTLSFNILDDQMYNSTMMVWALFNDFGTSSDTLSLQLQNRYKFTVSKLADTTISVGSPTMIQALFRRDQKYFKWKNWALLYLRIAYEESVPYTLVYNFNGVPNPVNGQIEFFGNFVNNLNFNLDPIPVTGLTFSFIFGQDSTVFLRNFQLWNSPFSLELAKLRALRSPNIHRFEHTLVSNYRFDESGGNMLFNTSPLKQKIASKIIEDTMRSDIDWVNYVYLDANQTFDSESKRPFLFCLEPNSRRVGKHCEYYTCHQSCPLNDCIGPSDRDCINKTNDFIPMNPRDQVQMVVNQDIQDSYECNVRCTACLMAFANRDCTGCVPGLVLFDGNCGTNCPEFQHFINGVCSSCSGQLCACTSADLDSCVACKNPVSHIYLFSQQMCLTDCPDSKNQFYDVKLQECINCHDFCDGCTGDTQRECKSCKEGYLLIKQTTCIPKSCPPGTFYDEESLSCKDCELPCAQCKKNAYDCTVCVEDYAFDQDNQCVRCSDIAGYDYPYWSAPKVPGGGACTEICGDGLDFGTYECDDGNNRNGDGCSSRCKIEKDYGCNGGTPLKNDVCKEIVGPSFEIQRIVQQNKFIYLQFDKSVISSKRNFTKEDLIIKINGVQSKVPLKYDINAVVTDIFGKKGQLVVNFKGYFSIDQATIQIGFKNASMIKDTIGNPISKTLSYPYQLDKQVYVDDDQEKKIKDTGKKASLTSKITLIANMVLAQLLGKAADKIWLSLNACQIIYFMPLMNIPFPKTLKIYLKFLDFANLDIDFGGDPFFYKYMNLDEVVDNPVSQSFEDYEFESSIFFFSYADKLQLWVLIIGAYPIVKILSVVLKNKRFNFIRSIEKMFRYNMIIRVLTELYLEITLHAFMNIVSLQYKTITQATVSFVSLAAMGGLTYFPALCMAAISNNAHTLDHLDTKAKIGELYNDTKIFPNKTMNQFFTPLFLFRRLIYALVLVLLKDYPLIQVLVCVLKTFGLLIFIVYNLPFTDKMLDFQHIMNESLTGIAFAMAFVFTKDLDPQQQNFHSYIILGIVAIILGFNILLVLADTVISIYEIIQYIRKRGFVTFMRTKKNEIKLNLVNQMPAFLANKLGWDKEQIEKQLKEDGVDLKTLMTEEQKLQEAQKEEDQKINEDESLNKDGVEKDDNQSMNDGEREDEKFTDELNTDIKDQSFGMSQIKDLNDNSDLIKHNYDDQNESGPLEITQGSMPLMNKRDARLQAILEIEAQAAQSLRPIKASSNLIQFGEGGVRSLERNILKSNRRTAVVPINEDPIEYKYEGKVQEEKKPMQDMRIIEEDESEEEVEKKVKINLHKMKPEENLE